MSKQTLLSVHLLWLISSSGRQDLPGFTGISTLGYANFVCRKRVFSQRVQVWTSGDEGIDYKFEEFIEENNGSRNDGNLKLQGLITLVESRSGDGGFCCVPGFHHNLKAYCENSRNTEYVEKNRFNYTFVNVPPGDRLHSETVHISTRAGSLIIWNSELPHCNCPNESSRIRMNQYIKMFPAHEGYPGTNVRREIMKQFVAKFEVTLLGRRLFGLERW
eukprot:TRINITY_DN188_c0_g2_i2.p2 TRINITY_DN188_c0_g2~~TRINITY_DN188_c0_g2_i2.p2  ORF type:complete len:218 (+),score=37.13 TRINITY_DN188_c0_g2_i2:560-1213(+)